MAEFKVGDKIRRIREGLSDICPIGFETVVTKIEKIYEGKTSVWYTALHGEDVYSTFPNVWELIEEKKSMLDFTKPITTRDGRKVRILCTDRVWRTNHPIIALVTVEDGEVVRTFSPDGSYHLTGEESPEDLINVPEKKYLNLYKTTTGASYFSTREDAEKAAKGRLNYVKTIEVEL